MKEETYKLIGKLAIGLYVQNLTITFDSLNSILKERGLEYESNRGLAAGITAAINYWEEKDPVIHHAIVQSYVNKKGEFAYENK